MNSKGQTYEWKGGGRRRGRRGALTGGGRAQALQAPGARQGAPHAAAAAAHYAAAVRVGARGQARAAAAAAAAASAEVAARLPARFAGALLRPHAGESELQPQTRGRLGRGQRRGPGRGGRGGRGAACRQGGRTGARAGAGTCTAVGGRGADGRRRGVLGPILAASRPRLRAG